MKASLRHLAVPVLLIAALPVSALTYYVDVNSTNPVAPYTNWATAANVIQDAVDAADAGNTVLVTNGVYDTGGKAVHGLMTNRVAVDKPLTLQSVNGPQATIIKGYQLPVMTNGNGAVRCVYLANGAFLRGFTLTNGATRRSGHFFQEQFGGGLWCESTSAWASNCVLIRNSTGSTGGGAYSGTLIDCSLRYNSSDDLGGGAADGVLRNCVLENNSANVAGGACSFVKMTNCIVRNNSARHGGAAWYGTSVNCVLRGNTAMNSGGAVSGGILINCTVTRNSANIGGGVALGKLTNCIVYYNAAAASPNDYQSAVGYSCILPLPIGGAGNITNAPLFVDTNGWSNLRLQSNSPCISAGNNADITAATDLDGNPRIVDGTVDMGAYEFQLPPVSVTHYVNVNSTNPVAPYTNWATAASVIQDAVDAANPSDTVLVTNGVYDTGGKEVRGATRVAVDKPLTLLSVNGPEVTVIEGYQVPGTTYGEDAVRCVYLTNGAFLSGFTLTNGATRNGPTASFERDGGGLRCESTSAVASNCVLTGNSAHQSGGGSYRGTLYNCRIEGNSAFIGGGSRSSVLVNSVLSGNSASAHGGGSYDGALHNCVLQGNSSDSDGGGAYGGTLNNCTVTGNSAGDEGGGCYSYPLGEDAILNNCVVYFNTAVGVGDNYSGGVFHYSCTLPLPTNGIGNVADDPQLASFSHLSESSPCIGAGSTNYISGTDIDGEPWASPPSIGCDEFLPGTITGLLSVDVLASFTNVSVDFPVDLVASIDGRVTASTWAFGDGTVLSNQPYASHAWSAPGNYPVVLRAFNETWVTGIAATVMVEVVESVHYVAADGTNPTPPYSSWETASTNIQDAVDVAYPGGTVWVTDGDYATGGKAIHGALTNRVAVDKPLTVESVNGPAFTFIRGHQVPGTVFGDSAVRCVYLTNGAVLKGFTLEGGATRSSGDTIEEQSGGGLWCEGQDAVAYNCAFIGNAADFSGGGAQFGTVYNCLFKDNSAGSYGGGARIGTLNNCTLVANSANISGGGASSCSVRNSIAYFNTAVDAGDNYSAGTFFYSCTTPLPNNGAGNISENPLLASAWRLSVDSPCRGAGDASYSTGTDIDGEAWATPLSMGCDEYWTGSITGALSVAFSISATNVVVGSSVDLVSDILGKVAASSWDFGNGNVLSNQPYAAHSWTTPGDYSVTLTAYNETSPEGVIESKTVSVVEQPVHYVDANGTNPTPPYSFWATAATRIQDAVDAAIPGALILVTNGFYSTGGRALHGTMTNRVAVDKPTTLQSVNGPDVTMIVGAKAAGGGNGNGAVRCVYLADGAVLSGFTLTNGATLSSGDSLYERRGGGLWCESIDAKAYDCSLMGNSARSYGGGTHSGTLYNCTLTGNSSSFGGGSSDSTLVGCTVIGNSASFGGGANDCILVNCIAYHNTSIGSGMNYRSSSIVSSCTTPLPSSGIGNFTNAPLFVDTNSWADMRLQSNSPCINAGNNAYVASTNDLDGNLRIIGGMVDMGAYEFQSPQSMLSYAWLQQYGLPTDGSVDYAHSDADPHNNWQEWKAWTDPTNELSVLRMLNPEPGTNGTVVSWQSVSGRRYLLERATNGSAPYSLLQGNIVGDAGTTSFTDTTTTNDNSFFYRVGVPE